MQPLSSLFAECFLNYGCTWPPSSTDTPHTPSVQPWELLVLNILQKVLLVKQIFLCIRAALRGEINSCTLSGRSQQHNFLLGELASRQTGMIHDGLRFAFGSLSRLHKGSLCSWCASLGNRTAHLGYMMNCDWSSGAAFCFHHVSTTDSVCR